jgi:hypothetical protein
MPNTQLDFARLKTTPSDGDTLVEPRPAHMRALVDANARLAASWDIPLADLDLRTVRQSLRQAVAGADDGTPVLVSGHQPEFIHPGVWAKHIVAARCAQAVAGLPVNLIVDTDTPKQAYLSVPAMPHGRLALQAVACPTLSPSVAYESTPPLAPGELRQFEAELRRLLEQRFQRSMLGTYCRALAQVSRPADFVDQFVGARRAVEAAFGIELLDRRVSRHWVSPLLVDLLANAARFHDCYNRALADYRRDQAIRGNQRPIPDLARDAGRIELPLWVALAGQSRQRLFVETIRDRLIIYGNQSRVADLPVTCLKRWEAARSALAGLGAVAFHPRALTLTLWARMLLADLFIHGIGGAKYDRITDLLIRRYFGVAPPGIACASATLHLDLPTHDVSPQAERNLSRDLRDLRCNPQRHLDPTADIAQLLDARRRAVQQSDHLRATQPGNRPARRQVFDAIRSLNRQLLDLRPTVAALIDSRLETIRRQLDENAIAFRRDYFFVLYDRPALERLCAALPQVEDFRV